MIATVVCARPGPDPTRMCGGSGPGPGRVSLAGREICKNAISSEILVISRAHFCFLLWMYQYFIKHLPSTGQEGRYSVRNRLPPQQYQNIPYNILFMFIKSNETQLILTRHYQAKINNTTFF